ncbi:MAG: cyanophycin synthetase, partial [Planctomycetota bacterium]|nr:cyanophycin synthetase [Planctomycetota bacterium]
GSLEEYAAVKASFFRSLGPEAHAVVNIDDPFGEEMAAAAREGGAIVHTYSVGSRADLSVSRLECGPEGTRIVLEGMGISKTDFKLPLLGRHNVENALAAAAATLLSGASPATVVAGLAAAAPPPGRLEPADPSGAAARGFRVLVDYAHTPGALSSVLGSLRELMPPEGRILCVFGCGGDRDQGKRPEMGAAVARLADAAYLTSDNPRGEDPERILDEVEAGMQGGRASIVRTADRRAAIAAAIADARSGDVVLIAGKGHERVQLVGDSVIEFDDRRVAEELLA